VLVQGGVEGRGIVDGGGGVLWKGGVVEGGGLWKGGVVEGGGEYC
jgi:hypothetical protein